MHIFMRFSAVAGLLLAFGCASEKPVLVAKNSPQNSTVNTATDRNTSDASTSGCGFVSCASTSSFDYRVVDNGTHSDPNFNKIAMNPSYKGLIAPTGDKTRWRLVVEPKVYSGDKFHLRVPSNQLPSSADADVNGNSVKITIDTDDQKMGSISIEVINLTACENGGGDDCKDTRDARYVSQVTVPYQVINVEEAKKSDKWGCVAEDVSGDILGSVIGGIFGSDSLIGGVAGTIGSAGVDTISDADCK